MIIRITKIWFLYALLGAGLFLLSCNLSIPQSRYIVENRKAVPDFSIEKRIPGKNYVHFIALGDQGNGGSRQQRVAHLMNEKARADSLDFVITLGDNFYDRGVTSTSDNQWLEKFEHVYDLPHLQVPFYASLGNHDHRGGNARYQIEYGKLDTRWKMPNYYYTFSRELDDHATIQFFALDTQVIMERGENEVVQLEWLVRELENSQATWKIVYGHHPVFSYGKHGNQEQMIGEVRPFLESYDVDLYISGHDHDRQLLGPVGGVYYVVSGTGAKSRDTRYGDLTIYAETNLGFAWFRASSTELHMQFIDEAGDIEYAHTWTKEKKVKGKIDEPEFLLSLEGGTLLQR